MIHLLVFLLILYVLVSYGYIFALIIQLYLAGLLKEKEQQDVWLITYVFSPVFFPFIYGMSLAIN